jgi:predicted nucleic acid-binding protein
MSHAIISDSSSLIMVARLERLDLLTNLFQQIYIPQRVAEEITAKEDSVAREVLSHPAFAVVTSTDHSLLTLLDGTLDYGEAEALTLAQEKQLLLLIDEKKGRKIAKNMGLKIIGLLGVLLLNQRRGHIPQTEALDLLEQIKRMDFRLSAKLESDFLQQLQR